MLVTRRGALLAALLLVAAAGLFWIDLIRSAVSALLSPFRYYARTRRAQARMVRGLAPGAVLFLGDSHVAALQVSAVHPRGVNLGIGGDTVAGVLTRFPPAEALRRAAAVVLLVGTNDVPRRPNEEIIQRFREIHARVPVGVPLVWIAIPPVDPALQPTRSNERIRQLNEALREMCQSRPGCAFVDLTAVLSGFGGGLSERYHVGDGLHLNPQAYRLLAREVQQALGVPA